MTPTKALSLALFFGGLLLLLATRIPEGLDGSWWAGVGLLLIAASFFTDALLPGGSELSDEQIVMLRHSGVPYRKGAEKVLSIAVGVVIAALGLWMLI